MVIVLRFRHIAISSPTHISQKPFLIWFFLNQSSPISGLLAKSLSSCNVSPRMRLLERITMHLLQNTTHHTPSPSLSHTHTHSIGPTGTTANYYTSTQQLHQRQQLHSQQHSSQGVKSEDYRKANRSHSTRGNYSTPLPRGAHWSWRETWCVCNVVCSRSGSRREIKREREKRVASVRLPQNSQNHKLATEARQLLRYVHWFRI